MIKTFIRSAAIAGISVFALTSQAATVTLMGNTIVYEYDDVANSAALALFGTPTIVGDTVRFLPPNFRAESNNSDVAGPGTIDDIVAANFVFSSVRSKDGTSDILDIAVNEFGDYEITNGGSVSGDLLLTVATNNPAPEAILDFGFAEDEFEASGDSGGKQLWEMSASYNPSQEFVAGAFDVAVTIQNTLTATTGEDGELAWIQKKLNFVATNPVPLPAAAWLFGSALLGLVGVARKRDRS